MQTTTQPITGQQGHIDTALPIGALTNFYKAFNNQNFNLMQSNWLQTEEASMSNPLGGIKRGWREIESVYQKIFSGPATVYVEFYDYTIYESDSMFVAVGRERGTLKINNETIEPTWVQRPALTVWVRTTAQSAPARPYMASGPRV